MADDMTGKIMEVLSNPEMMKKLSDALGDMNLGGGKSASGQPDSGAQMSQTAGGLGALGSLLGSGGATGSDDLAASAHSIMNSLNHTVDRRITLLTALKPYLRESRAVGADKAIRLLRMSKLTEVLKNEII